MFVSLLDKGIIFEEEEEARTGTIRGAGIRKKGQEFVRWECTHTRQHSLFLTKKDPISYCKTTYLKHLHYNLSSKCTSV